MRDWLNRHRKFIPEPLWNGLRYVAQEWFQRWEQDSYGQTGEDLILRAFLLEQKRAGFYVDVGAHHPRKHSNTYRLYRSGWRGINIDAAPGSMRPFRRTRPRDINIEAAVGSCGRELTFFIFNDAALNTSDPDLASWHAREGRLPIKEIKVKPVPLRELLDRHLPEHINVDLLTVDVEGLDYDVLASNDWSKYSPEYVMVECLHTLTLNEVLSHPVTQFLASQNYQAVAKTLHTVFYRRMTPAGEAR